jgi:hypothetical protein
MCNRENLSWARTIAPGLLPVDGQTSRVLEVWRVLPRSGGNHKSGSN